MKLICLILLQIYGINMAVGVNGVLGKPMIREGREIHLFVRRSLRDIFRKVPNFALEVKVWALKYHITFFTCFTYSSTQ